MLLQKGQVRVLLCIQGQDEPGLMLADMHCLPGMEGGPVMSACGKLLGVLSQPLCSHSFKAEASPSCSSPPCMLGVFTHIGLPHELLTLRKRCTASPPLLIGVLSTHSPHRCSLRQVFI